LIPPLRGRRRGPFGPPDPDVQSRVAAVDRARAGSPPSTGPGSRSATTTIAAAACRRGDGRASAHHAGPRAGQRATGAARQAPRGPEAHRQAGL